MIPSAGPAHPPAGHPLSFAPPVPLPASRSSSDRDRVKKGIDGDDSRRKREATTVQLRKDRKEDSLQQKRRRDVGASSSSSAGVRAEQRPAAPCTTDPSLKAKLDSLPDDFELLKSSAPEEQLEATSRFRKLLSIERNPPIAEVIAIGAVPRLVQFCQCYDNPPLLFEAAWALTNISSGTSEHTRVVIDNGAIPIFIRLVACPHADVREQAVWALGNIAGDSTRCRDLTLSYNLELNMLPSLLAAMGDVHSPDNLTFVRNATWTVSNLVRGKPAPRWELIAPALPALVGLIRLADEEVLVDACWALSYMCEPPDCIGHLIVAGVLPRLVELLGHSSPNVQTPALRCLGNVTSGTTEQTQAVLSCGTLAMLGRLLASEKRDLKKEACWMLSNVTAGAASQIEAVCASGCVPQLAHLVETEEFDIRKEAAYALCNACIGGAPPTLSGLVYAGVVRTLCSLLELPDADLVLGVLEALHNIFAAAEASDPARGVSAVVDQVETVGGVDKLEALQTHANAVVYERAAGLLEVYFAAGAEHEDASLAPRASAEAFSFGLPTGPPPAPFGV
mmetsp:Transcript_40794/g.107785  ORF Transcript_40794/g.107785 Transcript_40794/m.107785 type:complete len:564 (+) Transcript_40794:95-1786(+)